MDYELIITKDAKQDIDDAINYIKFELCNSIAAKSMLDNMRNNILSLKTMPSRYPLCSDNNLKRLGYRKIVINNYLLFYRIDEKAKTVYIMRFIYAKRDYINII